jgi:hypothetical protein
LSVAEEEVWTIRGGKRRGDGSSGISIPVKLDEQTDGMVAAVVPLKTGDVRESMLEIERSSDDGANVDLPDPPDGDFLADQASWVTVSIITAAGNLIATVDTGSDSIWVGWAEFVEGGGTEFEEEDTLAQSADGSPLAVVGKESYRCHSGESNSTTSQSE